MARSGPDDKPEHPIFALGALGLALLTLGVLTWLVASNRIVWASLSPALLLGGMWKLLGNDFGFGQWNHIVQSAQLFASRPNAVSFGSWVAFVNVVLRPIAVVLMLCFIIFVIWLSRRKRGYMRKFTADSLMKMTAEKFTGVAPVMAIRMKIAQDKHPLWRTQVTPEEVFLNYRVPSQNDAVVLAPPGAPMVQGDRFDRKVALNYFAGLQQLLPDGRMHSTMLGRQIVNLPTDAHKGSTFCFADRMSPAGKTLLALWAAVAFGGKEGREEFSLYRDKLNRSAFGSKDGMANLSVAQPLFSKYRNHKMLSRLFAVHHWEFTVLFQLLALAQKKGRFTTAEVLWLRPTNRQMYFALNSRGSATPHTEAASCFAMHMYERGCAKEGRLPLYRDEGGVLRHTIYLDKAVDGLLLEWQRWEDALPGDEDDWWLEKDLWKRTNNGILAAMQQVEASAPKGPMPGAQEETLFDRLHAEAEEKKAAAEPPGASAATATGAGAADPSGLAQVFNF